MGKYTPTAPSAQAAAPLITPAELAADINARAASSSKPEKLSFDAPACFPLSILPPKLEELIKSADTTLGLNPDFLATAVICAASAAVGATCRLRLKGRTYQYPVFYACLIAAPGSNKSGAFDLALKPIQDADDEAFKRYKAAKAEHDAKAGLSKRERKEQFADDPDLGPPPAYTDRRIVVDTTPEALVSAHADNPQGLLVYRDELAGWVKDFNRYSQGSEQEFWLSNWSGKAVSVDRKTSAPLRISRPAISVCGTIQPGVLDSLASGERDANGFAHRLLFVWPDGLEKPLWTLEDTELYLLRDYDTAIGKLLGLDWSEDEQPHTLELAADAKHLLFGLFNDTNKPFCDSADTELLAGLHSKFDLHTARLAIALHLLKWAYSTAAALPTTIEASTIEDAAQAAEYFRGQSLKVYERLHNACPVDDLPRNKRQFYDALPQDFATADAVKIGQRFGIKERAVKEILSKGSAKGQKQIFERIKQGNYAKVY
jgi:hypothetical protein